MKNLLVLIISIMTLSMTTNNTAEANVFNKFKKGFYFEKYTNVEEAKAALLELHPVGSDVQGLVRTLEGSGAIVKQHKTNDGEIIYFYEYDCGTKILNPLKWSGGIRFRDTEIIDYGENKHYMGL